MIRRCLCLLLLIGCAAPTPTPVKVVGDKPMSLFSRRPADDPGKPYRTLRVVCADADVSDAELLELTKVLAIDVWLPNIRVVVERGAATYPPAPVPSDSWRIVIRPLPPAWDASYPLPLPPLDDSSHWSGMSWPSIRYAEVYTGKYGYTTARCPRWLPQTVQHEWGHLLGHRHDTASLMRVDFTREEFCNERLPPPKG